MTHKERIKRIQDEIRGVVSQYGVTQWEIAFLADIEKYESISDKQAGVLWRIERKVFGDEE